MSTYLVTYDSQYSTPFICKTAAAEHESLSCRFPTPGDVSETFVRTIDSIPDLMRCKAQQCTPGTAERAAMLVLQGAVGSHYGVISTLVQAWARDDENYTVDHDRPLFGRSTVLWQELINRAESNGSSWKAEMMAVWPKEGGDF